MSDCDISLIVRSRPVVLEILESRGYEVAPYRDIAPTDIYAMASSNTPGILTIKVNKIPDGPAPKQHMTVLYWTDRKFTLNSHETVKNDDENHESESAEEATGGDPRIYTADPMKEEVMVVLTEPYLELYNSQALMFWEKYKLRVTFFNVKNLISNPAKHVMVPPHRRLTSDETSEVLKHLHMRSVYEFPHIKFHFDMQARVHGLVPGDVVEIKRPSETAGIYTFYRVCVP
jgi:DNA-directed RNA polymerase subunit H (RpoH/RPB5)